MRVGQVGGGGMGVREIEDLVVSAGQRAGRRATDAQELVRALVRIPTQTPEECKNAVAPVVTALNGAGYLVEKHLPDDGGGSSYPIVIGWLGERSDKPDVLLCAHVDTSPPGEGWQHDPFGAEVTEGCIYGRGAAVSKSDIATFVFAAEAAWRALESVSPASMAVAITSDEGSGGSNGAGYLLKELKIEPRLALFPGFTEVITTAHSGCIQIKVRITGTACHQSLLPPPEDAMKVASQLCSGIYALSEKLQGVAENKAKSTLNITRVSGGNVFGMSPREVEIWVDRRVSPVEENQAALSELVGLIERIRDNTECCVEYDVVRDALPMKASDEQKPFIQILRREAADAFALNIHEASSTLYTDARLYSNAGIPTIMYGAGEANVRASGANGANERLPIQLLETATIVLARAITRFIATPT